MPRIRDILFIDLEECSDSKILKYCVYRVNRVCKKLFYNSIYALKSFVRTGLDKMLEAQNLIVFRKTKL